MSFYWYQHNCASAQTMGFLAIYIAVILCVNTSYPYT
jgi:hypothetical protein